MENVDPNLIDFQPTEKLLNSNSAREFSPPTTDEDIAILSKYFVLKNPVKKYSACLLQGFRSWIAERNQQSSDSTPKCPYYLLKIPKVWHLLTVFLGS